MADCHGLGDFHLFQDDDLLYRRVHHSHIKDGKIEAAHCPIKQWEKGLSCDWSVMVTPETTSRGLTDNILTIPVGECRKIGIEVRYCPIVERDDPEYNLAHCLLFFPLHVKTKTKKAELRDTFLRAAVLRTLAPEPRSQWFHRAWRSVAISFCNLINRLKQSHFND